MARSDSSEGQTESEQSFGTHLTQLDHWTFLLALGVVTANIVVVSPHLSALAALLLLVAFGYDAYEFFQGS